jgi:hypothetical protein
MASLGFRLTVARVEAEAGQFTFCTASGPSTPANNAAHPAADHGAHRSGVGPSLRRAMCRAIIRALRASVDRSRCDHHEGPERDEVCLSCRNSFLMGTSNTRETSRSIRSSGATNV